MVIKEGQIVELLGYKYYVDEVDYNGVFEQYIGSNEKKFIRGVGECAVRRLVLKGVADNG